MVYLLDGSYAIVSCKYYHLFMISITVRIGMRFPKSVQKIPNGGYSSFLLENQRTFPFKSMGRKQQKQQRWTNIEKKQSVAPKKQLSGPTFSSSYLEKMQPPVKKL